MSPLYIVAISTAICDRWDDVAHINSWSTPQHTTLTSKDIGTLGVNVLDICHRM